MKEVVQLMAQRMGKGERSRVCRRGDELGKGEENLYGWGGGLGWMGEWFGGFQENGRDGKRNCVGGKENVKGRRRNNMDCQNSP